MSRLAAVVVGFMVAGCAPAPAAMTPEEQVKAAKVCMDAGMTPWMRLRGRDYRITGVDCLPKKELRYDR